MKQYQEYILEHLKELLAIDSPSGFTGRAADYLMRLYQDMGYEPVLTRKGGVIVDLGGEECDNAFLMASHIDTLGAVIAEIKENGRLRISPVGGYGASAVETENCRVYTRGGKVYEGTCQLVNASLHVNTSYKETLRDFQNIEIVLDEDVHAKEDVKALGIENGDFICFDTATRVTESGYIKSRFLDDKLSAAVLIGYAKYLKDTGKMPKRKIYQYFTVFEEIGHGASASIPEGVTDVLSVDMGCVGDGIACTEKEVSICAKDSGGPYNYDFTTELIQTAKEAGIAYAVDVYPSYGSDVEAALKSGFDVRHGLIGPGVYASHGYERGHVDGMMNAFGLLVAYLDK